MGFNNFACATLFLFGFYWNTWWAPRAEIRTLDTHMSLNATKHEAYTLWFYVSCPDYDPAYDVSLQPVKCDVEMFHRPGMIVAIVGFLAALLGSITWLCKCCGSRGSRVPMIVVFAGSLQMFIGWFLVLSDNEVLKTVSGTAWMGSICGAIFTLFAMIKRRDERQTDTLTVNYRRV